MIKLSWGIIVVPIMIIFNGGIFAVEVVMMQAGTGSLNNAQKQPSSSGWYAIIIDAKEYQYQPDRPHGLPDTRDGSKPKEFYALYPSLYCSGQKREHKSRDGSGNKVYSYEADSCSPWGQLFDLQETWRDWGVDLIKDNYIGQNPRIMWSSLLVAACMTALSTTLKVLGFCFFHFKIASCVLSWISFACLTAMSATLQGFAGNLVRGLQGLNTAGTGQIVGQGGPVLTRVSWALSVMSLLSVLVETFLLFRAYRRRRRQSAAANMSTSNAGHGMAGSYQQVGESRYSAGLLQHGGPGSSRFGSQIELISGRPSSRLNNNHAAQQTAYEPMRHRDVG